MGKLILSLDGGGIRGAATTQFLYRIEEKLKKEYKLSIRDCVDFYAGTSTGSIIAIALATTKLSMNEINNLYNPKNAKKIFLKNKGWFEIDGINAPKYESEGKLNMLKSTFGDINFGDTEENKHILAVTYSIKERKPLVIKSTDPNHTKLKSYDVADASSAAPTYFPTKRMEINNEELWLIDGGVTANNPTMCAIVEAKKVWKEPLNELRVLSIGTGYKAREIDGSESRSWGVLEWFSKGQILGVLSDERIVDYQVRTILEKDNYLRVNCRMNREEGLIEPPDDSMDNIDENNIQKLKSMGNFWFEKDGERAISLLIKNRKS
ncbi:MAG: patatin [Candidatus Cloacimonadota bacterium]|nr:MAG: patatin [Candidatus Cloacimonadota bacterium]PIE81764.1 MAG: patatin [Candidatus Delongbacteria bacterium]